MMATLIATAAAPIQKGAWMLTSSPSRPARYGATAPPENRTKLYAAEATGARPGPHP